MKKWRYLTKNVIIYYFWPHKSIQRHLIGLWPYFQLHRTTNIDDTGSSLRQESWNLHILIKKDDKMKHWITIRCKHWIKIRCKHLFRLNKLTTSSGGRLHPEPQSWSTLTSSQKLPYFFNFLLTFCFARKTRSVMKNLTYPTTLLLFVQRSLYIMNFLLEFPHLLHIPFQF